MIRKKEIFYYLILGIIILISFYFYSSMRYPLLNSDDALNVLMAHYYKLPHDIYCWGQDRGGTIIPLISQIFIKVFHFSAITSISLSNYLILIIGFIGFSSLFKTNFYKILFALIWFLPFQRFIDLLRFPIGIEYSLIAISIILISKIENKATITKFKRHIYLISIVLVYIVTLWVSDLASISIFILLAVLLLFNFLKNRKIIIKKEVLFYFILGLLLSFFFLRYAKSYANIKTEHYLLLNSFREITKAFLIVLNSFADVLTFKTKEIMVTFYCYSSLLFIILFNIFIIKKKLLSNLISNKYIVFLLIDFLAIFITFLFSSWVLANGMGRWYFVASYISLSTAMLLSIEQLEIKKIDVRIIKIVLVFIICLGSISPIYTMKYDWPKTLKPKLETVKEFKKLGQVGLIGDFLNSYINSCADPEIIIATPHDKTFCVRNFEMVDKVFEQKKIYVIKDMWFDVFPDTITQFGRIMVKDSLPFKMGDCDLLKYRILK